MVAMPQAPIPTVSNLLIPTEPLRLFHGEKGGALEAAENDTGGGRMQEAFIEGQR